MKNWFSRVLVLMIAGLVLSGCVASQAETKINADGTGTNTFKIGFASEFSSFFAGAAGDEDPFKQPKDDVANYPKEWEATVNDQWKEKLGEKEFSGIQIDMKFKDLAMLNAQLTEFTKNSESADNPTGGALANLKVEEVNNEFVVSGTANATDLAAEAEADPSMAGMGEELKKAVIVWKVTMPGEVKSFEPADIGTKDGNTVTWKIPVDKTATYQLKAVSAKSGGGLGGGSSLPLILGIIGALALLGGLAFFFMNRNKKPAVAAPTNYGTPPAGNYGQPYDPNAGYNQPQGGYQQPYDPNAGYNQPQGGYQQPYDPNAGYNQPQAGSGQVNPYDQPQNPNDPNRRG